MGLSARCGRSLATLLNEATHELLGILLEHLVDLVQNRVDVVIEALLALGDLVGRLGLGRLFPLALLARSLLLLSAVSGHAAPPSRVRSRQSRPYKGDATLRPSLAVAKPRKTPGVSRNLAAAGDSRHR